MSAHSPPTKETILLRLLLLLGIGANIAFLLINFSPERPHFGSKRKMRILVRAPAPHAEWMKRNELEEFGGTHDADLELIKVGSYEEVLRILKEEAAKPTGILAATISDEFSDDVRAASVVRPLTGLLPPPEIDAMLREFLPEATRLSRDDHGVPWFIPRRGELTVAVYVVDAVEQAYLGWEEDRPAIERALKEANGFGLPRGYTLEKSPDSWDSYDQFVAAWFWAHHAAPWADPLHPRSEKTAPMPRMAWRTGSHDDAVYDLLGSFYRHGMTDQTLGQVDHPAVIDALQWEMLFRKHHLLVPECERKEGLTEDDLNEIFRSGRLAWAPMDQEDSFYVHGGARRDAAPGMAEPSRLDWAAMPVGMSLEMKDGTPARVGRSFAFDEMQYWTIPIRSPDPELALEWMRFSTQRGFMQRETEANGMLPVRKDLRESYSVLFRVEWMQQILDASFAQQRLGSGQMPGDVEEKHLDERYTKLRDGLLAFDPPPLEFAAIREKVKEVSRDR